MPASQRSSVYDIKSGQHAVDADKLCVLSQVLLRELQHRTANVLQFASLQLEVQARRSNEGGAKAALHDISRSFQQLIQAQKHFIVPDAHAAAQVGEEVRAAYAALAGGYASGRPDVRFDCIVDNALQATVRPAGVLALIISELVANAYKHAFRTRESGYLLVTLAAAPHGRLCLTVVDDGPGFEAPRSSTGTGLSIVRSLAEAIGGDLSVSSGQGAECKVRVNFPSASTTDDKDALERHAKRIF